MEIIVWNSSYPALFLLSADFPGEQKHLCSEYGFEQISGCVVHRSIAFVVCVAAATIKAAGCGVQRPCPAVVTGPVT